SRRRYFRRGHRRRHWRRCWRRNRWDRGGLRQDTSERACGNGDPVSVERRGADSEVTSTRAANPEPRTRSEAPDVVGGVGELAVLERQASAPDALRQPFAEAL